MSGLEELRAQAAAEEAAESEQSTEDQLDLEVEEAEKSDESETAVETEESEEVDEIDLSLDDEPQVTKPTPEQALVFKLTKEKKKRQEATSELEQLRAEIEALKAGSKSTPVAPQQAPTSNLYPPVPLLYENGINTPEAYQQAYMQWSQECRNIDQRNAQQDQARTNAERETQARAERLAQRSVEFITANKIKAEIATDTIQAGVQGFDEVLGIKGAALQILDNIGDGSDKFAYYLGKNPDALATAKRLFSEDPSGIKVAQWATNTAGKLNRKNSTISKAPTPDEPLAGDGSTAMASKLQALYDKETDFAKLREIKAKAKGLGITLK